MKHFKKILAAIMALMMVLSTATVLTFGAGAEITNEEPPVAEPSLSIDFVNLVFEANVGISYAVSTVNTGLNNVKLLVWDAPQTAYTVENEPTYTIATSNVETIDEEDYLAFDFTALGAKNMVDKFYAVAYVNVGGEDVYSDVVRYSVLEYAYDILGKDGSASDNENLKTLVSKMLEYGAAAQIYENYKTESLATADLILVKTENGTFADGFYSAIVAEGTELSLTATETIGDTYFHSWVVNNKLIGHEQTATVSAEAGTYTARYYKLGENGDYVYELDSMDLYVDDLTPSPIKVDGVMEDGYENGILLGSYYYRDPSKSGDASRLDANPDGTTFEVRMVADYQNVYVYYHFDKQSPIFYNKDYTSTWHEDNVDFFFNATGASAMGKEFHILGGIEGGKGTAAVSTPPPSYVEYFVKHDAEGYGYSVEFSIPIEKVTGTDDNGNKMFSFAAIGTLDYLTEGDAEWNGTSAPKRTYTTAYKKVWSPTKDTADDGIGEDGKDYPSYVVIKRPAIEEQDPATTPIENMYTALDKTAHYNEETGKYDGVNKIGDYVYKITKSAAGALDVDGEREEAYTVAGKSVHQKAVAHIVNSGSTFDVYYAADNDYIYVLYEFTKREPIYYYSDYATKYHEDCVDFVLDLSGNGNSGNEFRILAGIEGDINDVVADCDLKSKGVEECYVKHTYKGYNVEFSIPLSKVTGKLISNATAKEDTGKITYAYDWNYSVISFTACATVTTGWNNDVAASATELSRLYTTANSRGNLPANNDPSAKNRPNYLAVATEQDTYELNAVAGTGAVELDGTKDTAYESGLHFASKYNHLNANNGFDLYMTADEAYVYGLYVIRDDNICIDGTYYYHNDCADFMYNVTGARSGSGQEFRIWGAEEGTNHYATLVKGDGETDEEFKARVAATPHKNSGIGDLAKVDGYTVVHTAGVGYNVEFKIARSRFSDANIFSFIAMATSEASANSRTYPCIENNSLKGGDHAKVAMNKVIIIDAN